jgi:eukaryotic-like serine/threonine-protein kinase
MTGREAKARAEARVGSTLNGKYRLDRVLGVGGMAVVYEVTHRNQKRFALKMLHAELSVHEDIRRRFLREGYAANTVDHPGALAVLDDDTSEDGSAFLVMELLDGLPLDAILAQNERRLPPEAVLSIADQLLDVLVAAHAKGIVHRDLKPANLFSLRDGTVKVLDFGIARLQDSSSSSQATHTGVMLGTPAYMPPEQALAQSSEIDSKTDLWAVGATLFTLLSGANVHPGQTATQILVAAAMQPARSVTAVAPWVDPRVVEVVDHALAFKKEARWESAQAMRDAVRAASQAVFEGPPSRAPLAALLKLDPRQPANPAPFIPSTGGASSSSAGKIASSPEAAPTSAVETKQVAPRPQVAQGSGAIEAADAAARGQPPPSSPGGNSTATPVSNVSAHSASAATPPRRGLAWALGGAALAILAFALLRGFTGGAASGGPGTVAPSAASPAVAAPTRASAPAAATLTGASSAPRAAAAPDASVAPSASAASSSTLPSSALLRASASPGSNVAGKASNAITSAKPLAAKPPAPTTAGPASSAKRPSTSDNDLYAP